MQLYGSYTSPYVRHCRIVLLETGLPCEFIESDGKVSAARSPAQKLPFLCHEDLLLTDSSSIIRYLREQAGQRFFPSVSEYDLFCLANTAVDAAANLFVLEKDGVTPSQSSYLQRQEQRIQTCLSTLNRCAFNPGPPYSDFELRLGCILGWARFRGRFDFSQHERLSNCLADLDQYPHFAATAPA